MSGKGEAPSPRFQRAAGEVSVRHLPWNAVMASSRVL